MKRIQFRLDETTHKFVKNRAYAQQRSMASLVRDALDQYLKSHPTRKISIKDPSSTPSTNS